jgi:hypothetical protein
VLADRHLLLDLIEELTPAYEATFIYTGLEANEEDHTMNPQTMAVITDAAALAIDSNLPELREDSIACMIKLGVCVGGGGGGGGWGGGGFVFFFFGVF